MKRLLAFIYVLLSILTIAGCSGENMEITNTPSNSLTLGKLEIPEDKGEIGNQIPQWRVIRKITEGDKVYWQEQAEIYYNNREL